MKHVQLLIEMLINIFSSLVVRRFTIWFAYQLPVIFLFSLPFRNDICTIFPAFIHTMVNHDAFYGCQDSPDNERNLQRGSRIYENPWHQSSLSFAGENTRGKNFLPYFRRFVLSASNEASLFTLLEKKVISLNKLKRFSLLSEISRFS